MKPGGYIVIIVGSFLAGGIVAHWAWEARHNELLAKLEREARKSAELTIENERLNHSVAAAVAMQLFAENKARETKSRVITKEVVKYVEKNINSACELDTDFVRIHDAATPVSGSAEGSDTVDGPAGRVQNLGRALEVVTHNYDVCQDAVNKLEAWQQWYRETQK